ncbi:MAG TPA: hypothetical protein VGY58_12625 [Gemmataceae bacterium]|nr:hypothetical protein [Gemmataceae bacterium]
MLSSMPEPESSYPKPLSSWFDLSYFRRRSSPVPLGDRFLRMRRRENLKWLLIGVVLLACIGWPLAAQFTGHRTIYQSHPVSTAHTMFNQRCEWCHTSSFEAVQRFWPGNAGLPTVKNDACLQCHDGPIHHDKATDSGTCAECHREHRGHVELARVADGQCTLCHADLQRHSKAPSAFANVHGWNSDHPEFGLLRRHEKDPGAIRFNHSVHLNPEGVRGGDGKPEKLECRKCHGADTAGRYMKPINYEEHCARCHLLDVKVAGAEKVVHAPHKEPRIVQAALRDDLTRLVQTEPGLLAVPVVHQPPRPLPGGMRVRPVTDKEWSWVSFQLEHAERVLFDGPGGCRYCHEVKDRVARDRLPEYAKTEIQARWLKHSIFSHRSHRELDCLACHGSAPQSKLTSDVLLPAMAACQECHRPQGARTDCAECHLYHDRTKEKSQARMSIMELLNH